MRKLTYVESAIRWYLITGVLTLILLTGSFSRSVAEKKPDPVTPTPMQLQDKPDDKSQDSKVKSLSDDEIKVYLKQIEIYGTIAKPQTVFIVPGTDPRVDGLRIDRHFFSHIFRPVEKSTLRSVRIKQGKGKDHILW